MQSITATSDQDKGLAPLKRRRGPRLRPVNCSKRSQDAEHQRMVEAAVEHHDRRYADRDPNGTSMQRLHQRFYEMGPELPAPPVRQNSSEQKVMVLKRLTVADTLHPEARAHFDADELAEVVDETFEAELNPDFHRHVDRIEGGIHRAMIGFQSESQEKAMAAHEKKLIAKAAKARRRAARAGHKVETDAVVVADDDKRKAREEAEKFAQMRRDRASESYDRYKHGFFYKGSNRLIAGDAYTDDIHEFFGEDILRSHLSPSMAMFAQATPRKGRIRAGYTKEALFETTTKLIALDCPYVELDTKRMCCIVVEFDTVWASAAAFRQALLQYLPARMLPNLIVGRVDRSGMFARPHCIWSLNPCVLQPDRTTRSSWVWNDPYREMTDALTGEVKTEGDKRCKVGPIRKFQAVQRGLVAHLLPLGADPSCWNIWKPKNPLSPFWSVLISNDDFWPELDDFIAIKDFSMKVDEKELARRGAEMRAEAAGKGEKVHTPSNLAWATVGQVIEPMVANMLRVRDLSFVDAASKGAEALAGWFDDRVRPIVEDELNASPSLDRILEGRCIFAANYCIKKMAKRGKRGHAVNRGRDDDLKIKPIVAADGTERMMNSEERLHERNKRSGATRHAVALWRMGEQLSVTGLSVDELRARKTEVIKGLDFVSQSFAYDNWDEALALLSGDSATMYKDKKLTSSRPVQSILYLPNHGGRPSLTASIPPSPPGIRLNPSISSCTTQVTGLRIPVSETIGSTAANAAMST